MRYMSAPPAETCIMIAISSSKVLMYMTYSLLFVYTTDSPSANVPVIVTSFSVPSYVSALSVNVIPVTVYVSAFPTVNVTSAVLLASV